MILVIIQIADISDLINIRYVVSFVKRSTCEYDLKVFSYDSGGGIEVKSTSNHKRGVIVTGMYISDI